MIDWSVVATSGVVSAVVGGLVSLATIHQLTVRRVRAEETEGARRELAAAAGRYKRKLQLYTATPHRRVERDDPDKLIFDDHVVCCELLLPTLKSGKWRAMTNYRRLVKLFGANSVAAVSMYRDVAGESESGLWTVAMFTQQKMRKADLDTGEWHSAWCIPPGSEVAKRAIARLDRLERSSMLPW